MSQFFKTMGVSLFFGALIGAVLAGIFSPQIISWWFTPPVSIAITCKEAVEWGISTYRETMLGGSMVGAILGTVAYIYFKAKKKTSSNPS